VSGIPGAALSFILEAVRGSGDIVLAATRTARPVKSLRRSAIGLAETTTGTVSRIVVRVGRTEAGQAGSVDPVVQAGLRFLPTQLAIHHLPGQRADLGGIQLVGVVVGLLPVGGGGGRNGIDRSALPLPAPLLVPLRNPVPAWARL
jgi:hypothetical protein